MRERHLAYRRHLRARPGLKRELDQAITAHAVDYLCLLYTSDAADE